jgi:molybdenum cofactor biosynthesis enzyme MoaA
VSKIVSIDVSVDAATEDTYAGCRSGGSFTTLLENLKFVATTGLPLRLNFVVQASNFREMIQFAEMASDLGAYYVRFDAISNWVFSAQEYLARAVHITSHPLHSELKRVLKHPVFSNPRVHTAKLSEDFFITQDPLKTILLRVAKEEDAEGRTDRQISPQR